MKDHYAVLGVSPDAPADVIKASYRRKANQYHPDKNPSPDAALLFRQVQESYEVLSDEARRHAYDENSRRSLIDDPAVAAREIWSTYINEVIA